MKSQDGEMNERFVKHFDRLWTSFSGDDFMSRFDSILEKQAGFLDVKLRSDGKVFLYLNFRDMIAGALDDYRDDALNTDIYLILKHAKRKMKGKHGCFSAHSILSAVHDAWDLLALTNFWG